MKAPWNCQDVNYPSPHFTFLEMHYLTSILMAVKDSSDNCDLNDDDDDYGKLSDSEEVQNELKWFIIRQGDCTPSANSEIL